jgi:hypothetical protein
LLHVPKGLTIQIIQSEKYSIQGCSGILDEDYSLLNYVAVLVGNFVTDLSEEVAASVFMIVPQDYTEDGGSKQKTV